MNWIASFRSATPFFFFPSNETSNLFGWPVWIVTSSLRNLNKNHEEMEVLPKLYEQIRVRLRTLSGDTLSVSVWIESEGLKVSDDSLWQCDFNTLKQGASFNPFFFEQSKMAQIGLVWADQLTKFGGIAESASVLDRLTRVSSLEVSKQRDRSSIAFFFCKLRLLGAT